MVRTQSGENPTSQGVADHLARNTGQVLVRTCRTPTTCKQCRLQAPASSASKTTAAIPTPIPPAKGADSRGVGQEVWSQGFLVIPLACRYDAGPFADFVDDATHHLSPCGGAALIAGAQATGLPVLLIVDGLNETARADELTRELRAVQLRNADCSILVTTRDDGPGVRRLCSLRLEVALPDEEQRARLEASYGVPAGILAAWRDLLQTPLDYKLAGHLGPDTSDVTPYGLLHAYVLKKLREHAEAGFTVLTTVAAHMTASLSWSLPRADLDRISRVAAVTREGVAPLFDQHILTMKGDRFSFWHEQFKDFFEAEHLLMTATSAEALAAACARPRHRDAAPLVLAASTDTRRIQACLEAIPSVDILVATLRGDFGPRPAAVAESWARDLFMKAERELGTVVFEPVQTDAGAVADAVPTGLKHWSEAELRLCEALQRHVKTGAFLAEYLDLLIASDRLYDEHLERIGVPQRLRLHIALANLLALSSSSMLIVARLNPLHAFPTASWSADARAYLRTYLERPDEQRPVVLYLLCRCCGDVFMDDGDEDLAARIPPLLRASAAWRLYHLTLAVAWVAETRSQRLAGSHHDEMEAILTSCLGKNPILNGAVFEALTHYTEVDVGVTPESALDQVRALLQQPRSPEGNALAGHAFGAQFEDLYQGAYRDAIGALEPDERAEFLVRAGLGIEPHSFFVTSILEELLKHGMPDAGLVFARWATPPERPFMLSDELGGVFLLAHVGLARARVALSPPSRTEDPNVRAWRAWGEIVYWLHRDDLPEEERRSRCRTPLRLLAGELLSAAIDAWYWLERYARRPWNPTGMALDIERVFPEEERRLLEDGLRHADALTSVVDLLVPENLAGVIPEILAGCQKEGSSEPEPEIRIV